MVLNSQPIIIVPFQDTTGRENYPAAFNLFFLNSHRHIQRFASIVALFCAAIAKKIMWGNHVPYYVQCLFSFIVGDWQRIEANNP